MPDILRYSPDLVDNSALCKLGALWLTSQPPALPARQPTVSLWQPTMQSAAKRARRYEMNSDTGWRNGFTIRMSSY
jgi:hypothetical protein